MTSSDYQAGSNQASDEARSAESGAFPGKVPLYKPFTPQEFAVVTLLAAGLTYKAAAAKLNLKTRTVRFYAENAGLKIPGTMPVKTRILLWYNGATRETLDRQLS